jgi:hypothetical protein
MDNVTRRSLHCAEMGEAFWKVGLMVSSPIEKRVQDPEEIGF